ncbi:MAG: rRNA pseudouridine synthase [Lachnospiraceae bacterium]|nr:rRNA pseudouridine synthase [Lachnospiraceae bacterium]
MGTKVRLDRFISNHSKMTRTEASKALKSGKVTVNGDIIKAGDVKIDEENDKICIDGVEICDIGERWYVLNKPAGYVCANEDKHHKTVFDLMPNVVSKDLFVVGRLDIDTEGMVLITNNGNLAHEILSPKKHIWKDYLVKVKGVLDTEKLSLFENGIQIDDYITCKAKITVLEEQKDENGELITNCRVSIREGKFHQIKKMFAALDCEVIYLFREKMGDFMLPLELEIGNFRQMTEEEIKLLYIKANGE